MWNGVAPYLIFLFLNKKVKSILFHPPFSDCHDTHTPLLSTPTTRPGMIQPISERCCKSPRCWLDQSDAIQKVDSIVHAYLYVHYYTAANKCSDCCLQQAFYWLQNTNRVLLGPGIDSKALSIESLWNRGFFLFWGLMTVGKPSFGALS